MIENKDSVTIFVRGREVEVSIKDLTPDGEISFERVIGLAYNPLPTGTDIVYEVNYFNGAGRPPEGNLLEGELVKIQDGTVFNVSYTDRS